MSAFRLRRSSPRSTGRSDGAGRHGDLPRRIRAGETWCETFAVLGYPREVSPGWLSAARVPGARRRGAARRARRERRGSSPPPSTARPVRVDETHRGEAGAACRSGDGNRRGRRRSRRSARAGRRTTVPSGSTSRSGRRARRRWSERSTGCEPCAPRSCSTRGPVTSEPFRAGSHTAPRHRRPAAPADLRHKAAAAFPFASAELESSGGIFLGRNATTGGLCFVDRFALENHNQVILARSGAGKSYLAKLQILRSLYEGVEVLVIDPEDEYRRPAEAVGGVGQARLRRRAAEPAGPSEAGARGADRPGPVRPHPGLESARRDLRGEGTLDRAILAAYEQAGITSDPRTHARPAPVLADVVDQLRHEPSGPALASTRAVRLGLSPRALRRTGDRPRGGASLRLLSQELPRS